MKPEYVNIHTHCPTGRGIELHTAGIHPWEAAGADLAALEEVLKGTSGTGNAAVQALGETGLDAVRGPEHAVQLAAFRSQLALARRYNLPVVLHCVRAFGEVMRCLAVCEPRAVIFHGFIGSPEQARQAVDKGYWLSFGERTFASPRTLEALRSMPLSHVFFETDDSPTPIEEVYRRAAEALGTGVEALQRATTENYERIFTTGSAAPSCEELKKER